MSKFTNMQKYWQQLRWSLYFKRQINITDCNSPCETMCYWFMFIAHHYLYLLCLQNEMKRVAGLSSLNNLTHFDDISALTEGRAPQVLLLHCFDISLSPISQLSGFRFGALSANYTRLRPDCHFPPVNGRVWTESILSDLYKALSWLGRSILLGLQV